MSLLNCRLFEPKLISNPISRLYAYEVYFGKYDTDPNTWDLLMVTTSGKNLVSDLESNVMFSTRVRAVGTKGKKGEWSKIVTRKTY